MREEVNSTPNLDHKDSSLRTRPGRIVSRHGWLATLCGLWLALLSPKVILGLPGAGANGPRQQLQAGSAATAKAALPSAIAAVQISSGNSVPGTLKISPTQTDVAVGRKLSFRLLDEQGRPIHDATWMVSDFTVAELDSVDPPRIAAVAPGEVTVTAISGEQTVQAKVIVVKSPRPPAIAAHGSTFSHSGKGR
jgi:hypothetical protein